MNEIKIKAHFLHFVSAYSSFRFCVVAMCCYAMCDAEMMLKAQMSLRGMWSGEFVLGMNDSVCYWRLRAERFMFVV